MSGDKYLISDKTDYYFVTFTIIHCIDIFSRKEYRDIAVDALNYCITEKGLVVYAMGYHEQSYSPGNYY